MKKKIMVFMLLFAFLVGFGVPDQAKAAADEYTFEEWCNDNGYECKVASDEDWSDSSYHFDGYVSDRDYIVFLSDGKVKVFTPYMTVNNYDSVLCYYYNDDYICTKTHNDGIVRTNLWQYEYHSDGWHFLGGNTGYNISTGSSLFKLDTVNILYSSDDIYSDSTITDVVFEKSVKDYTFYDWCTDAGLNCIASSNELNEIYPFEHDLDCWYLVRKNRISGSQYTWYLCQVNLEPDHIFYVTNRALADSTIGAFNFALDDGSADYSSSTVSVNNYVYDSSGEGWLYVDRSSTDLGFTNPFYMDDIGISFSSSMPIVYSDADIYSNKEQSSVYYAANTEYEDSEVTYPDISPTSTPTPTPISNSGSTDLGGNVIAGGGIDFIISLVSSLWNRVYSIPMYVDGFQITLQQLYVYGILAGIVGAAIFAFTRRK